MKFTFEVDTAVDGDAILAARVCYAILDITSTPHSGNRAAQPSRQRNEKAPGPRPVGVSVPPASRQAVVDTADRPPASLEEMQTQLRDLTKTNGILWLRPLLEQHGAAKISDLPEDVIRSLLAEIAAA